MEAAELDFTAKKANYDSTAEFSVFKYHSLKLPRILGQIANPRTEADMQHEPWSVGQY